MLANLVRRQYKTTFTYQLVFDDGHNNGYGFPCDEHGTPNVEGFARAILERCKAHPEGFIRKGVVVKYTHHDVDPAHGTCECGAEVTLEPDSFGACQCPSCGRWYNMNGENILPPSMWEEALEENY